MMLRVAAGAALTLCAAGAFAQMPAASPDRIAAAKAEADRVIAAAHAEAWFVNTTANETPTVRHTPSGMTCNFTLGQSNVIRVFQGDAMPGEDVSCGTVLIGQTGAAIVLTQYAARHLPSRTVEQELQKAEVQIRVRDPAAKVATGAFQPVRLGAPGSPSHEAVRFEIDDNGQRVFSRAAAAAAGDWMISQRITTPISDAAIGDRAGEILISVAANEVAQVAAKAGVTTLQAERQKSLEAQTTPHDAAIQESRRLLASVTNPGDFTDLTSGGVTRLRHKASGVICEFGSDAKTNRLQTSGQGLTCSTMRDGDVDSLQLVYAPTGTDAQTRTMIHQYMDGAFISSEPMEGDFRNIFFNRGGAPPHDALRYLATTRDGGGKVFMRAGLSQVGNWTVLQRVVGPTDTAKLADDFAEQELVRIIGQVMDRQSAIRQELSALPKRGG